MYQFRMERTKPSEWRLPQRKSIRVNSVRRVVPVALLGVEEAPAVQMPISKSDQSGFPIHTCVLNSCSALCSQYLKLFSQFRGASTGTWRLLRTDPSKLGMTLWFEPLAPPHWLYSSGYTKWTKSVTMSLNRPPGLKSRGSECRLRAYAAPVVACVQDSGKLAAGCVSSKLDEHHFRAFPLLGEVAAQRH